MMRLISHFGKNPFKMKAWPPIAAGLIYLYIQCSRFGEIVGHEKAALGS